MNDTAFWMGISQNIHFHLFFAAFFVFNYCLHDQEWNPIASSSAVSARLRFFCLSFFVWMIGHLLVLRIHWMKTWIFLEMFESCKMVAWYAQVFYHKIHTIYGTGILTWFFSLFRMTFMVNQQICIYIYIYHTFQAMGLFSSNFSTCSRCALSHGTISTCFVQYSPDARWTHHATSAPAFFLSGNDSFGR